MEGPAARRVLRLDGYQEPRRPHPPITLVLPLPPNAANSRRIWQVVLRDKKRYWAQLDIATKLGTEPRRPPQPFKRAAISAHLYVHNIMDTDNAFARIKVLQDWLKGLYIADDSPRGLVWSGVPEQTIDRKNPRIEIGLQELLDS